MNVIKTELRQVFTINTHCAICALGQYAGFYQIQSQFLNDWLHFACATYHPCTLTMCCPARARTDILPPKPEKSFSLRPLPPWKFKRWLWLCIWEDLPLRIYSSILTSGDSRMLWYPASLSQSPFLASTNLYSSKPGQITTIGHHFQCVITIGSCRTRAASGTGKSV